VKRCDTAKFGAFFRAMLERGILLPPSQFEALFVSATHSERDIAETVAAVNAALRAA
jgi:glutamate-1-semialdehyde 2,1-aminomutase